MPEGIVELPINMENVECVTECWTYNRMIILKTSPYYEDWIASHYNLFATKNNTYNYSFLFGETRAYTPDYYDDILVRKQINYFEQTEDGFVDTLKGMIRGGSYVNIMVKPYPEKEWFHELVLYGYNDNEKLFKGVGLEKHFFQQRDYTYEFFENTLPIMKEHFKDKQRRGVGLSMQFQYPISAFRLREGYSSEGCVFEAFRKIRAELDGERFIRDRLKNVGVYEQTGMIYRGISCLDALSNYINDILDGKTSQGGLAKCIKKLYEHRRMMIVSMKYLQKKWEKAIHSQIITESITGYEECNLIVEKWVNLSIKYELTGNQELLKKIVEEIPKVFLHEYDSLSRLVNHCVSWDEFNQEFI